MGNSWKIEIRDFQSLAHVKMEIPSGITLVTGKTNQGKSAVIRAIDSALFNMGDDSMVRGGKRYSGVLIDNGTHRMMFCRDSHGKNEKTAYQFDDGTVQKKVGRSQLPEVAKMFNIRDVRMQNGTKMRLNFWYQNDKPFLMDKTSGQMYEFLSVSSCDRYTRVLKRMAADMKVQEADISNVTTEIDTLKMVNGRKTDFIKRNDGYDDLYVRIITADQRRKSLDEIGRVLSRMTDLHRRIGEGRQRLEVVSQRLQRIPMDSIQTCYDSVCARYTNCVELGRDFRKTSQMRDRIVSIESDRERISRDCDIVSAAECLFRSRVSSIENVNVTVADLGTVLRNLRGVSSRVETGRRKLESLDIKLSIDTATASSRIASLESRNSDILGISSILRRADSLRKRICDAQCSLDSVDKSIEENERELSDLKKSAGYCPFCGTVFVSDNIGG